MTPRCVLAALLLLAAAAAAATAARAANLIKPESGPCGLLNVCYQPRACRVMRQHPPPTFSVRFHTNVGDFTIDVVTAWAPPFATRFWQLSKLRYMDAARFYRVAFTDFSSAGQGQGHHVPPFVVQFGYSGDPAVDACWDQRMTSNATARVVAPGNQRGYVSMSMGALPNKTAQTPHCSPGAAYCALGFSTNIFINYANNSRLDAPGFAVFGRVSSTAGMAVVDALYRGYGEVADLCPDGSGDAYCNGFGANCRGVNMSRLAADGTPYLKQHFPRLSYIRAVKVLG